MSMATQSRPIAPKRVYQLLIELDEVEPRVWRRLWVPDTLTMAKLDRVIQAAMGWTNSHLHEFEVDGKRYGIPDEEGVHDTPTLDDRRHKVGAVLGDAVSRLRYTYDFGDNWRHTVTVEDRLLPDESFNTWPLCIAGQNACPPEDVGGVGGYNDFLEAISDPSHDEHAAMWQWSGGPFDPAGFDVNATNAALRRLR
jgi:hypothetical protein